MKKNEELIKKIRNTNWYFDWSGPFCLLEVSTASEVYFSALQSRFGKSLTNFLVIYVEGIATALLPSEEVKTLGEYLAKKTEKKDYVDKWAKDFRKAADALMDHIRLPTKKFITNLEEAEEIYKEYGEYNVATKLAFDYIPSQNKYAIELLENARRYSEKLYKENAEAFLKAAKLLSKETNYPEKLILMMTRKELYRYQKDKKLPEKEELKSRYNYSGCYFDKEGITILPEREIRPLEEFWSNKLQKNQLKGLSAYPGKVKGVCKIIKEYKNSSLNEGEILVTGMTDPHFLPIMKKAAAIITDGGGLLSHAAIVAREFKIPCIVGTKIATKVLKNRDLVEVDANKGTIRKIS